MVQLEDGALYQAGEFLDKSKDKLLSDCKIIIEKCRVDSSKQKFVVCKIVQQGDWSGLVEHSSVTQPKRVISGQIRSFLCPIHTRLFEVKVPHILLLTMTSM